MKIYAVFTDYGDGPIIEEDKIFFKEEDAYLALSSLDNYDKEHADVKELRIK
jgi:hypothetical protein